MGEKRERGERRGKREAGRQGEVDEARSKEATRGREGGG